MAAREFHHLGVQTTTPQPGEKYIEGAKVYITDPEADPYRMELLRFEAGSPMHPDVQTQPHAAFLVPSLEDELAGKEILIPPFDATPELRCAFIKHNGFVIEVMEKH